MSYKVPYTCPRCGYNTPHKPSMRDHLLTRKKACPAAKKQIELTESTIDCILENRVYHEEPKEKQQITNVITNYNQFNNVKNIIANMDTVEKLEKYISYKGLNLVNFEDTIEDKFKDNVAKLDTDAYKSPYHLKEDNLLQIVSDASKPSRTIDANVCSHNIIYDKGLKEIQIYDGSWDSMPFDSGTKHYVERIQCNLLNSYECYLLRNIHGMRQGQNRTLSIEVLETYFSFIGCFELDPFCKSASDDQILSPSSISDEEETVVSVEETYDLSEEFYPIYKRVANQLARTYKNKTIKNIQNAIKSNTAKKESIINKRIANLVKMDTNFQDIMMRLNFS
jgi:hypothetical protein